MNVIRYTAFLISIILHPVFLPIYLMIWYLYVPSIKFPMIYLNFVLWELKMKWLLLYALLIVIMPLIIISLARIFKIIEHMMLSSVRDRKYFFLILGVYYWFIFYMFDNMYVKEIFKPAILLIIVSAVLLLLSSIITNPSFVISIHTAGLGVVVGFFIALTLIFHEVYLSEIMISTGITVLVMLARIILSAHTFTELIGGWLLGIFSCVLVFLIAYPT